MAPFLLSGDRVRVQWTNAPETASTPGVGDVVLHRDSDGSWILHRMIARQGARFISKGDAAMIAETLDAHAIWGIVSEIQPKSRMGSHVFRPRFIDRQIARISRLTLNADRFSGKLLRIVLFWLCLLRRKSI